MNTIQIRRARPSALALALALLLTMLFVYAAVRPALSNHGAKQAAAAEPISTELRMEGLEAHFLIADRCDDPLQARILAARCAQDGGAGLILPDGDGFAIIRDTGKPSEDTLSRSSAGLTLRMEGSAAGLAAVSDAVSFLRAQATETSALAGALENGDTDAASLQALMRVYHTQGRRVLDNLAAPGSHPVINMLQESVSSCLMRLDSAIADPSPASIRLVHAAACAQWLGLQDELRSGNNAGGFQPPDP